MLLNYTDYRLTTILYYPSGEDVDNRVKPFFMGDTGHALIT